MIQRQWSHPEGNVDPELVAEAQRRLLFPGAHSHSMTVLVTGQREVARPAQHTPCHQGDKIAIYRGPGQREQRCQPRRPGSWPDRARV